MNHSLQETLVFQLHHCLNMLHRGHHHHHKHGGHADHSPQGAPADGDTPEAEAGRSECRSGDGRHHHGHEAHRGQGHILAVLKERGALSQKDLADILRIQPPSLSEVISKLEAQGLIERRKDADDKRRTEVSITEEGRKKAEKVEAARQEMVESLLSGLSEEEQQTMSTLLGKLATSLETRMGCEPREPHGGHCGGLRHGGHHHCGGHHHKHHHGRQEEAQACAEHHHGRSEGKGCCGGHHGRPGGEHAFGGHHGQGHGCCTKAPAGAGGAGVAGAEQNGPGVTDADAGKAGRK